MNKPRTTRISRRALALATGAATAVGVGGVVAAPASAASPPTYVYKTTFGSPGRGNGQLSAPYGVTVNAAGDVYVADNGVGNSRVEEFNPDGTYKATFGSDGAGNGQLFSPFGVALNAAGDVYVADTSNNRVEEFNPDGTYKATFGSQGSGNGQLTAPYGVTVNAAGDVYATDYGNNRVEEFNPDGSYKATFGSPGAGNGQLNFPVGVAVDTAGDVFVADSNNNRVEVFNSDGTYQTQFGSLGSGNGQLNFPVGVAVDTAGDVYVADSNNSRVEEFAPAVTATTTTLVATPATDVIGGQVTYTATVTPAPDGGTVAFTDSGSGLTISGCGAQPVDPTTGQATCTTTYTTTGTHQVTAAYTGDTAYATSTSTAVTEDVGYGQHTLLATSYTTRYGSAVAIVLRLTNAAGKNLSASDVTLHATAIDGEPLGTVIGGTKTSNFPYQRWLKAYSFLAVQTPPLTAGKHTLAYTVTGDSTTHTVTFTTHQVSAVHAHTALRTMQRQVR